jgi:hypothetical protein
MLGKGKDKVFGKSAFYKDCIKAKVMLGFVR